MKSTTKMISASETSITIQVTIPIDTKSMLSTEESILKGINEAGSLATSQALSCFDTDGRPITLGKVKYTSKGQVLKYYQTPYGEVPLYRHVYQSNLGGSTFCPLEQEARIIGSSTPRMARMVSSKYSQLASSHVQRDFKENHGRNISRAFIQNLSESVSEIRQQKHWTYTPEVPLSDVRVIGISLDGTCMLLCGDGYRQAMVGSVSLYNEMGERIHTRYTASPPQNGKERFYKAFHDDIEQIRRLYPSAVYVGLADGAVDNWSYLQKYVTYQILDFFHASEYLSLVSKAAFKRSFEGKDWLEKACTKLKNEQNGAGELLKEMRKMLKKHIGEKRKTEIQKSVTYFTNHLHQMRYWEYQEQKLPIGSGIIEAACKVIIKQRLCNSGMKWTDSGARTVLALRCTHESDDMWKQFWSKIDRYGR